jgi:hypothetical protein
VDLIAANHQLLVPQVDGGYRFRFGSFFAAVGAAVGYAIQLSAEVENLPGGNSADLFEPDDVSTVYAMASLEFGAYF